MRPAETESADEPDAGAKLADEADATAEPELRRQRDAGADL
jgi:hypothetical protein